MIIAANVFPARFANLLNEVEDLNLNLEKKGDQRTAELHDAMDEIKIRDEKIHKELQIAGRVQEKLMPEILPEWNGFRVVVNYVPLREVSGDFFDVFEFNDGDHGLMLGDASGHGVPAAIYTIMARNGLQRAKYVTSSPAEIFKRTNAELCNLDTGQYMTAFMVKFNKTTLHYTNAGHPKALFLSMKRRSIRQLDTSGTFIGAMVDAADTFSDASIPFEEGDKVIIYTDCLTEGNSIEAEEFGEKRLIDLLKKHFFLDIEELLDIVLNEFYTFTEGQERKDDLTLIGLEYTGE